MSSNSKTYPCPKCNGTGVDEKQTMQARRRGAVDNKSYIRCWNCNGNGLDPAQYFRWSTNPSLKEEKS